MPENNTIQDREPPKSVDIRSHAPGTAVRKKVPSPKKIDIAGKIAELVDNKGKEFVIAISCLLFMGIDTVFAIIRIMAYFISINRYWLWTSFLYMLASVVIPFVGWVYSTETDYFYYKNRKALYFYFAVVHAFIVLIQPLMNFTAATYFPYLQGIKITEVFSKTMVLWFARLISLILPALFLLVMVPLMRDTIFNKTFREEMLYFRLGHIVDERGDAAAYAYDCKICEYLDNGEPVVELENDRFIHKLVVGASGTGKTSSALLPQFYGDLGQKVKNDDKRHYEFERLVREGKAIISLPEEFKRGDDFLDEYIVPLTGYEQEYYDICKNYKSCGLILLAPDDETVYKAMKYCLAWGVKPKVIDPSAFHSDKKIDMLDYLFGINPLYVPMGLSVEGENLYVPRVSENLEITLRQASQAEKSDGKSDSFFENVNEHITSMIAQVTILYCRRVLKRQATLVDFVSYLLDTDKLVKVMSELEILYGKCDKNRLREDQIFIPKIKKDRNGTETKEYQYVDPEYRELAFKTYPVVGQLGYKLSETSFENTFNQIYTELLNPGAKGKKTNEIAENIDKWAYGLRNISSDLLKRPELKTTLTYPRSIDFDTALKNGDVIIVNFCLHLGSKLGTALGLMVQLALNEAVLRREYDEPAGCKPCFEICDELPRLIGEWYETTISLWRKYKCSFTGAIQSELQFEKSASTKYLKGIAEGSGTILIFGRTSAEEMDKFSKLAGKEEVTKEMENVTETSILSDNPTLSFGRRMMEDEEDRMSGTSIRNRDFQEGTHFGVRNGQVIPARAVKLHFVPDDGYEKKERHSVDFLALAEDCPITSAEEAYLRELAEEQEKLAREAEEKRLAVYKEHLKNAEEIEPLRMKMRQEMLQTGPAAVIEEADAKPEVKKIDETKPPEGTHDPAAEGGNSGGEDTDTGSNEKPSSGGNMSQVGFDKNFM